VTNEKALCSVKEERNILHKITLRKANWIGRTLRTNLPCKYDIEERIREG
jgi:hypothetical protein